LYRVGNYEDAEEPVKTSWVYFFSHIVGHINGKWKSMLSASAFQNLLLSRVTTASDEAYAILICKQKLKEWIRKKWSERKQFVGPIDETGVTMEEANSRAKAHSTGNDMMEDDADEEEEQDNNDSAGESKDSELYFQLFKQVQEKRASIQGSTWDLGYKMAMAKPPASRRSTASVDSSVSSKHSSQSKKSTDPNRIDDQINIEPW
jgi:hypothetical protein